MIEKTRHIAWFGCAGAGAAIINVGLLHLMVNYLDWSPLIAQLPCVVFAMSWSWWINRTYTFRVSISPTIREYLQYMFSMLMASLTNYGVFFVCVVFVPLCKIYPETALVPATIVSMFVTYFGAKLYVFAPKQDHRK
ncbi:MAG: GtrA family protein [Rhodospirillales bacterium]|nr:GtrA family protein [Rhodospirillales bacterium]